MKCDKDCSETHYETNRRGSRSENHGEKRDYDDERNGVDNECGGEQRVHVPV
jgi:hypothetical protein